MLVVFAVDIPLLLGFSVARFQDADAAEPGPTGRRARALGPDGPR
jgi:hypothetical protein